MSTSLLHNRRATESFASPNPIEGVLIGACAALLFSASIVNGIAMGMMLSIDTTLGFFLCAKARATQHMSDFPWTRAIASLAIVTFATIYMISAYPIGSMPILVISGALCALHTYRLINKTP
ncbi:MAG: hypothetical protein KGR16_05975 [Verrucomicrobia bacterium]|nr:hypothetical protein [Verrucomicrobiota bacterium]MDE3048187.1 hypothetical protein [Verrucomicrobiota bacterium]